MSGYLQRLAVSVVRPRPSLHPLVGSIFSGERQEMAGSALMQNDTSASTEDQNLVSTTRTVSGSMRRRHPATDNRIEQHAGIALPTDDRQTEQRRGDPEIFHPLLPRKTPEADISAMIRERGPEDVASVQSASIRLQHDPHDTGIIEAARIANFAVQDGPTANRQTTIAPSPVGGLSESAGMLAVVAGEAARLARSEFSPSSRHSAQSDDIQIHIGRIEVTAITQPMPRPAAPRARKAMSLDEYLGRRSRGAR
jgi:hypothetical protein